MGREARAKKAASVVLDPADFWQLRARIRDTEAATTEAKQAIAAALQRQNELFEQLSKKYGFDPAVVYRWDDNACTLIPEALPAKAKT